MDDGGFDICDIEDGGFDIGDGDDIVDDGDDEEKKVPVVINRC